jgi:hypothetical protein
VRPTRVLIAASVAALALAAPAGAATPQHEQETVVIDQPVENGIICANGRALLSTVTITRRITTYFDASGEPLRQVRHFRTTGTLYSDDLSTSAYYEGHARRELDYRTNTVTLTGRRLVLPLPGQDAAKTGREVIDATTFEILWESGRPLSGFEAEACAALYPTA